LAVHREQVGSDIAEHGHRYRRSAGESPGSPVRGDGAPEHERVVGVELAAGVGHATDRDGLRLEEQAAVDDRKVPTSSHPGRIAAAAEQQL
jgi:hypothetical protein